MQHTHLAHAGPVDAAGVIRVAVVDGVLRGGELGGVARVALLAVAGLGHGAADRERAGKDGEDETAAPHGVVFV